MQIDTHAAVEAIKNNTVLAALQALGPAAPKQVPETQAAQVVAPEAPPPLPPPTPATAVAGLGAVERQPGPIASRLPQDACAVLNAKVVDARMKFTQYWNAVDSAVRTGMVDSKLRDGAFGELAALSRVLGTLEGQALACANTTALDALALKAKIKDFTNDLIAREAALTQAYLDKNWKKWFELVTSIRTYNGWRAQHQAWLSALNTTTGLGPSRPPIDMPVPQDEVEVPVLPPLDVEIAPSSSFSRNKTAWIVGLGLLAATGLGVGIYTWKKRRG